MEHSIKARAARWHSRRRKTFAVIGTCALCAVPALAASPASSERYEDRLWRQSPGENTVFVPDISASAKLAGLSAFWSEARLNFVFFDRLPNVDWNAVYETYIPRVIATKSTAEYYRLLMQLSASLGDGHTNVYPPKELFDEFYASPGLTTRLVEGRVLVVAVRDPTLQKAGWLVGDELTSVNGQPVREYADKFVVPQLSFSTAQDKDVREFGYYLLSGPATEVLNIRGLRSDGQPFDRLLSRRNAKQREETPLPALPKADFHLSADGIATLIVNEFEDSAGIDLLRAHRQELTGARGLILDVRSNGGGNTDNGFAILKVVAREPFYTALSRTRLYIADDRSHGGSPGYELISPTPVSPDGDWRLDIPVAVLTSARTFSAAEDFAMTFDSMKRGVLVGEATGGSTGNPLQINLPGGGSARICAKDDRYPDGRVFEGVGVLPQIPAPPTVSDIRSGRDRAFEAAVAWIRQRQIAR